MKLNVAGIVGRVVGAPEPYHNIYGRSNVYALFIDTVRDSGTIDRVLVLYQKMEDSVNGAEIAAEEIREGDRLEVTGAIQTYKDMKTGRTQLFIWAHYIGEAPEQCAELNTVHVWGVLARPPVFRRTPNGRRITDMFLCAPSIFTEGYYSYIPCIAWGDLAEKMAEAPEGIILHLEGRLQSREYTKRTQEGEKVLTTWEVSASKIKEEDFEILEGAEE